MEDIIAVMGWSVVLRVREQPRRDLPRDTLHRPLVILPDIQTLVKPAVACFGYPTQCLAHKCPGYPHRGPLYMAVHALEALPSELDPALRTHLRDHFRIHAALHPQQAPAAAPMYLQPRTEPGISFHDLPLLAMIHGAIVATHAATTPAGMAIALAYEHARGEYAVVATSGVGTSQERRP